MVTSTTTVIAPLTDPAPSERLLVVVGTRPEAIKLAPLITTLADTPRLAAEVVSTGQHAKMLDAALALFGIAPDVRLDVHEPGQRITDVVARIVAGLAPVFDRVSPRAVVVQGDTASALAGALVGFYHRVPVVHVEAGLRTGDPAAPFPEETHRRLIAQLASLHLAPTAGNRGNLLAEGIAAETIVVTGNTVIDALQGVLSRAEPAPDPALAGVAVDGRRILLVTAHRRESWGAPLASVAAALAELATSEGDLVVVLPLHPNPVVRAALSPALAGLAGVITTEPLGYDSFARLMSRAHLVLTDSGGVQEEAPSLGKPVLVLRDTTERPEAVDAGTVRLVGTDGPTVVNEVRALLSDRGRYEAMARAVNPYGDGRAACRSVAAISHFLGLGPPAVEFGATPASANGDAAPVALLALIHR